MDINNELEYPLDEEKRDGCYVCGGGAVLDDSVLEDLHRCEPSQRPGFLAQETVGWRTEREYRLAYHAWRKMADKYAAKESSLSSGDGERTETEGYGESFSGEKIEAQAPVPERSYPLTLESRKKRLERTHSLKKEEKRAAIESLRKKQEQLRKLKEEYRKESSRRECHLAERKADYERRKQACLESLAREQGVGVGLLQARGDQVYRAYRQECKAWQSLKMEKIKRQEKILETLEQEKPEIKEGRPGHGRKEKMTDTVSRERLNITEVFETARLVLATTGQPKNEEADLGAASPLEKRSLKGSRHQVVVARGSRKAMSRMSSAAKSFRASRAAGSKKASRKSRKTKHLTSTLQAREPSREELYPVCAEGPANLESLLEGGLREAMAQMGGILKEIEEVQASPEESLPPDERVVPSPASVHIRDFYPAETKIATVKMFNTTNKKMYIQLYKTYLEPPGDSETIKVSPPEISRIWPGHCCEIEIIFSTINWGNIDEFKGKIWFWTCCPPKCSDVRYIAIDVKCTRASANPRVINKDICFMDKNARGRNLYKEYITIENRGCMNCRVYINRVVDNVPEWHNKRKKSIVTVQSMLPAKPVKSRMGKSGTNQLTDWSAQGNFGLHVVEYIISLMVEITLSPFRIYLQRGRVLKGMSSISVPVRFAPHMVDVSCAQDSLRVVFEGFNNWTKEEEVRLWGTLGGPVVEAAPAAVDLRTLVLGGRGNQALATLRNLTKRPQAVRARLPARLARHFSLEPASVLLRPQGEADILIRSCLGWDFLEDGAEFLKELNAVLEFRVELVPEEGPSASLVVLGIVAHPLGLTIHPEILDLGELNTTESTIRVFYLINHSMMEQEVTFLNLPEWCVILPGYGFLRLAPYQRLKMQFLYSPTYVQAGGPGRKALHAFEIQCTTVRRLASLPAPKSFPVLEEVRNYDDYIKVEETLNDAINDSLHETPDESFPLKVLKDIPKEDAKKAKSQVKNKRECSPKQKDEGVTEPVQQRPLLAEDEITFLQRDLKLFESLLDMKNVVKKKKDQEERHKSFRSSVRRIVPLNQIKRTCVGSSLSMVKDQKLLDTLTSEEEDFEFEPSQEDWITHHSPKLITVSLRGKAVVTDPLCQLSDQKIIFPATPLHSYSIVPIYLSCPSILAGPTCDCGKFIGLEDDPRAQVEVKFEFASSDSFLKIEPCSGILKHGEKIKVNLIFKPKANRKAIENLVEEEKKNASKGIHNRLVKRLGLSSAKGYSTLNQQFNSMKEDFLKCTKKKALQITVKCLIETTSIKEPFEKRKEVLMCQVCCPIIRPDFVLWAQDKQIIPYFELPCAGVGLKSQVPVEIHNINWKTIYLRTTVLNTDNTFYTTIVPDQSSCLPYDFEKGIPLEPQGCLKFDVVFAPKTVGKHTEAIQFTANNTSVECKMGGISREAHFKIIPQFQLIKLEAIEGQKVKDIIKVENKGVVNIKAYINNYFEKEINSKYIIDSTVQNFLAFKYEAEVSEDLKALIKDVSRECQNECQIKVEPRSLFIQPGSSGEFRITFFPQINQNYFGCPKGSDTMSSVEEEVCSYVKRVLITLGTSTVIADWTIVGMIKSQTKVPKKQKKKKAKARLHFSAAPTS